MNAIPSLNPADDAETGLIAWAERGLVPDAALRAGIRRLCAQRLHEELAGGIEAQSARFSQRIAELADSRWRCIPRQPTASTTKFRRRSSRPAWAGA